MKRVLLTGAGGYIGRALAATLWQRLDQGELDSLVITDLSLPELPDHAGLHRLQGNLGDAALLEAATSPRPDTVFHLAGITSRLAEEQFALGLRANVQNGIALFERLRAVQACPVLVFASSIGVFGTPLPPAIDDDTAPAPTLSYGAQKRMMEILLADYSRRGWIDGRAVRLSGVVARPAQAQVALSTFSSDLIREPAEGRRYTCPVGPDSQNWLISLPACVDNLLLAANAANAAAADLPAVRAWTMPALRVSAAEIVQALVRRFGPAVAELVDYAPQAALQAQFAQWPPLDTAIADRLGMRHDGDVDTLVARSLLAPAQPHASQP